jgi:hypothetical protein
MELSRTTIPYRICYQTLKNRDWNSICKEAADQVNKNMSEANNHKTNGSVKMGCNNILQYLNNAKEGFGSGPKGYQDAIDEAMEKNNLSIGKVKIIVE